MNNAIITEQGQKYLRQREAQRMLESVLSNLTYHGIDTKVLLDWSKYELISFSVSIEDMPMASPVITISVRELKGPVQDRKTVTVRVPPEAQKKN